MISDASSVDEYMETVDPKWKDMIVKLRKTVLDNIPDGFQEEMNYGMIGYVVPHSIYPDGYHVKPEEPLPFINLAAQKNTVSLYHMGIYGNGEMEEWFTSKYKEEVGKKPNMGKSCIRFRKDDDIPYELLIELLQKISVNDYIEHYERSMKRTRK